MKKDDQIVDINHQKRWTDVRDKVIPGLETLAHEMRSKSDQILKAVAKFKTGETDPEIRIIDTAALPASYFMRDSVLEAVRAELLSDYKKTGELPRGVELIGEEAPNGETKEIPDPTIDSDERGDGPTTPGNGDDNGSQTGSRGEDNSGDSTPESSDDGPTSDQKPGGEK
jgi:hypothetical protein